MHYRLRALSDATVVPGLAFLLQIIIIAIAGIPTWVWLTIRYLAEPNGFWQEAVVFGLGLYVLGAAQIGLLVIAVIISVIMWISVVVN